MSNQKQMVMTMTGEIFQPVRVFYKLHNKEMVLKLFNKLSCMEFDRDNDRWVWTYSRETKRFKFDKPYSSIPKHMRPIVLGSFFTSPDNDMYLDVGSIERAIKAIPFFDKRINRSVASVTNIGISNQLISNKSDHPGSNFDSLFKGVTFIDPEEKLIKLKEQHGDNYLQKFVEESQAFLKKEVKPEYKNAEILPTHFYEDGIELLEQALKMRQIVAFEHWKGNSDYSMADVIRKMTGINNR